MRRLSMVLVLVAVLLAFAASALDISAGKPAIIVTTGETEKILAIETYPANLPSAYTIYSTSATDAFYFKRNFDGTNDSIWVEIPAGTSMLVPAPTAADSSAGYFHQFFFSGHSDTLVILPWLE
jgi:hypothetical protein